MIKRDEHGALNAGMLVGGIVLTLGLAILVGLVLPVTDTALGKDAPGAKRVYSRDALAGRTLYIREGCFTCHSMQVRDAEADQALGPRTSEPNDYGNEAPPLIGDERLGPDLTCVGIRENDVAWHVRHLRHPTAVRRGSTMPSYAYLTTKELNALAAYLLSLTCAEGVQ